MKIDNFLGFNLLFIISLIANNDNSFKDGNGVFEKYSTTSSLYTNLNEDQIPDKMIGAISILSGEYFSEINKSTIEFFESILKNINSKDDNRLSFNKNISKEEFEEKCQKFQKALYYFTQNMKKLRGYVLCVDFDNISFKLRKKEEVITHIYSLRTEMGKFASHTDVLPK